MGDDIKSRTVTAREFAAKHPGIDFDQLQGFINHNEKDLYEHGVLDFRNIESLVMLIDERKFFNYLLYFPIQAP